MKGADFFYNNGDIEFHNFNFSMVGGGRTKKMPIITIYEKPDDYPKKYVARMFLVSRGNVKPINYIALADTLEELKAKMPVNMTFMDRQENDDPKIVGVYL